jgi:hypothetical protein
MAAEKPVTSVVFCGVEDMEIGTGVVITSPEFEGMRGARRCDLIGDWIDRLRELYCFCREEAEAEQDPEAWSFLYEEVKAEVEETIAGIRAIQPVEEPKVSPPAKDDTCYCGGFGGQHHNWSDHHKPVTRG